MSDLDATRKRLAEIDAQIIALIAERQQHSSVIGRFKSEEGLQTRNFAQEREVLKRAERYARQSGVSPEFAKDIVAQLIDASLTIQEQDRIRTHSAQDTATALVIGGAGRMGQWFADFLASQGYAVTIADPDAQAQSDLPYPCVPDWASLDTDFAITVIATPLRITQNIMLKMAQNPPSGLVFDLGSLKTPLRQGLQALKQAGVRVTSVHPMFGPATQMLSGRHVIFVDVGDSMAVAQARALFDATMAMQVEMALDDHDRMIAHVLGLSHALNLAFVTSLANSGEAASKLQALSSTTFDDQFKIAAAVTEENPHLYYEIQALNDYGTEALSALLYAVERIRSVVRAGDEEGFVQLMEQAGDYVRERAALHAARQHAE